MVIDHPYVYIYVHTLLLFHLPSHNVYHLFQAYHTIHILKKTIQTPNISAVKNVTKIRPEYSMNRDQ